MNALFGAGLDAAPVTMGPVTMGPATMGPVPMGPVPPVIGPGAEGRPIGPWSHDL